jgi:hypothetical protein
MATQMRPASYFATLGWTLHPYGSSLSISDRQDKTITAVRRTEAVIIVRIRAIIIAIQIPHSGIRSITPIPGSKRHSCSAQILCLNGSHPPTYHGSKLIYYDTN